MLYTDAADTSELFVGSTHFALEDAQTCEMTREWVRRQLEESAARLPTRPRQFVDSEEPWHHFH